MWIAHDSARPLRVPRPKPTRVHPSPPLVHRREPSLNLHHAPSTAISHPSPAHHKPRATSYATVLSITHHTMGANLPWFLNLPLDECIDQHTPQILTKKKRLNFNHVTSRKRLGPSKTEANSSTQPRRKGKKT